MVGPKFTRAYLNQHFDFPARFPVINAQQAACLILQGLKVGAVHVVSQVNLSIFYLL